MIRHNSRSLVLILHVPICAFDQSKHPIITTTTSTIMRTKQREVKTAGRNETAGGGGGRQSERVDSTVLSRSSLRSAAASCGRGESGHDGARDGCSWHACVRERRAVRGERARAPRSIIVIITGATVATATAGRSSRLAWAEWQRPGDEVSRGEHDSERNWQRGGRRLQSRAMRRVSRRRWVGGYVEAARSGRREHDGGARARFKAARGDAISRDDESWRRGHFKKRLALQLSLSLSVSSHPVVEWQRDAIRRPQLQRLYLTPPSLNACDDLLYAAEDILDEMGGRLRGRTKLYRVARAVWRVPEVRAARRARGSARRSFFLRSTATGVRRFW